jgi:competence protein ComEC
VRGRLLAVVHGSTRLAYGDRVEAQGVLLAPRASERFDYADFLSRSDVWALLGNASLRRLGTGAGHPFYARLVAVKRGFIGAVRRALPEPQAALLLGIVLGYRTAIAPDLEVRMIDTGLIHIVVISGLKATKLIQTHVRSGMNLAAPGRRATQSLRHGTCQGAQ